MIEAVNSVLSNAPILKSAAQQQSAANSFAANPDRIQQASAQAPYISLYIKVDVNFDKAILQMRDQDTGDVVRQIPSETQLEAYRRAQKVVAPELSDIVAEAEDAPDAPPASGEVEVSTAKAETPSVPVATSAPAKPSTNVSIDTSV